MYFFLNEKKHIFPDSCNQEEPMQYKITDELNINGFSVNSLHLIIQRNNGKRTFNTQDYFCIYIFMDDVEMLVDNRRYVIGKGSLAFVSPGQDIICSPECEKEGSVYVLAFSSSFYEKSAKDSLLLNSELFFNSSSEIHITPAIGSVEDIKKLIIERLSLYKSKLNDGLYIAVAHNCVETLILDGLLFIEQEKYNVKDNVRNFSSIDLVNKFRVLLQKHYKKEKQVSYYANLLHINPRRLTEMTEIVLNKTAKQVIIDKIISEGTRILKHSNLSISEVAYELGFNDEGNFSTFIKKHTQKNPSEIRAMKV